MSDWDMGSVAQWAAVLNTLLIAIFGFLWRQSSEALKSLHGDISRAFVELDEERQRLSKLEVALSHAPTREAIHAIHLEIAQVRGDLAVIAERVKPVAAIAERLQDNFLEAHK